MSGKVGEIVTVHGSDPQHLIETILRTRIYESVYWKESCHGLNAESLIERAVEIQTIGGSFGNQRPTEFLCLLLKLLQIQPSKEIIYEFINDGDFKYLRALAAFYLRLVGSPVEIYTHLEPLLNDYRKLRKKLPNGKNVLTYIDEFVDELLREERVCEIILPRIPKRYLLEENDELPPRISVLEEELEEEAESSSDEEGSSSDSSKRSKSRSRSRSRSTSSRSSFKGSPRDSKSRYYSPSPSPSIASSTSGSSSSIDRHQRSSRGRRASRSPSRSRSYSRTKDDDRRGRKYHRSRSRSVSDKDSVKRRNSHLERYRSRSYSRSPIRSYRKRSNRSYTSRSRSVSQSRSPNSRSKDGYKRYNRYRSPSLSRRNNNYYSRSRSGSRS